MEKGHRMWKLVESLTFWETLPCNRCPTNRQQIGKKNIENSSNNRKQIYEKSSNNRKQIIEKSSKNRLKKSLKIRQKIFKKSMKNL